MSRENLTVRVRNVLGIIKADLDLRGVVLVAGVNAAGKSSLLEAVGACVAGDAAFRGLRTKTDQAKAIHEGAQAGSIAIEYTNGKLRLLLPAGDAEQTGRPVFLGTDLGIGRARFMALKPDERAKEFFVRCKANPTKTDLKTWLGANPGSGLEDKGADQQLDQLWQDIEDNGWDAVAASAREYGTKRKGAWEQVTSDKWGSKKSATWVPLGLDPASEYVLADEQDNLAKLKAHLARLAAAEAAATVNREQLERDVAAAAGVPAELDRIGTEKAAVQRQLDDKVTARRALVVPGETGRGSPPLVCPHCGKPVRANRDANSALILQRVETATAGAPAHDLRKRIADLEHDVETLQAAARGWAEKEVAQRVLLKAAEQAQAKLRQAQEAGPVDEDLIRTTREEALKAERMVAAVEKMERARAIYQDWERNQVLLDALQPAGVRQSVLDRHLSRINVQIAAITQAAGLRAVTITSAMSAEYDGRPYNLISESERWRVDFTLAVLWHQMEDACLLLLDRFDVVVPQDQGPIIMALKKLKVTALVAMTAKERARVPDLEGAKVGTALWVDGGVVGPCR